MSTPLLYIYIHSHRTPHHKQQHKRATCHTATTIKKVVGDKREITALFVIKYTVVSLFFYSRFCFFAPLFSFDKKWLDDVLLYIYTDGYVSFWRYFLYQNCFISSCHKQTLLCCDHSITCTSLCCPLCLSLLVILHWMYSTLLPSHYYT